MKSFVGFSFNFLEGVEASFAQSVRSIIPPLSYSNHKGIMGRIAVLGGSRDYTGAPYYAANGALKFGADLSFVYCSAEAATPIKCYSPELMVSPFYKDEVLLNENSVPEKRTEIEKAASIVTSGLSRAHTLIVGPGLGRNPAVHEATSIIIHFARNNNIPLIVDADGLWLVTQNLNLLRGYSRCILTPNKAEFGRLLEAAIHEISEINSRQSNEITSLLLSELQSSQDEIQIRALSLTLGGVTILRKGEIDIICNGDSVYKLGIRGSPRRCGGQGDILSGCLGVSFYWANKNIDLVDETLQSLQSFVGGIERSEFESQLSLEDVAQIFPDIEMSVRVVLSKAVTHEGMLGPSGSVRKTNSGRIRDAAVLSIMLATTVVKEASSIAYSQRGRSMTGPDILANIGPAFQFVTSLKVNENQEQHEKNK